jgi:hypothetical protein
MIGFCDDGQEHASFMKGNSLRKWPKLLAVAPGSLFGTEVGLGVMAEGSDVAYPVVLGVIAGGK